MEDKMASHLTELIRRVKSVPSKLKSERLFFLKLINVAEYLRYENDFTDFEQRKAKAILKAYKLNYLLEIDDDIKFERAIQQLEIFKKEGFARTCYRCGRTLTKPESMRRGMGEECHSKVKDSIKLDTYFGG